MNCRKGMACVYSSSLFSIKHSKSSFFPLFVLAFLRGIVLALVMSELLAFSFLPSVSSFDLFVSLFQRHPTDHKTMSSKTLPPICLAGALFLDKDIGRLEGNLWYFQLSAPIMNLIMLLKTDHYIGNMHPDFERFYPKGLWNCWWEIRLSQQHWETLKAQHLGLYQRQQRFFHLLLVSLCASSSYKLDAFSQSCSDLEVWSNALHAFKHYHTSFTFIANFNVTYLYLPNHELSEKIISWCNTSFLISTTFPMWLLKFIQWIMES